MRHIPTRYHFLLPQILYVVGNFVLSVAFRRDSDELPRTGIWVLFNGNQNLLAQHWIDSHSLNFTAWPEFRCKDAEAHSRIAIARKVKGFESRDYKLVRRLIETIWLPAPLDYIYTLMK
jgi:hypothetical protein